VKPDSGAVAKQVYQLTSAKQPVFSEEQQIALEEIIRATVAKMDQEGFFDGIGVE